MERPQPPKRVDEDVEVLTKNLSSNLSIGNALQENRNRPLAQNPLDFDPQEHGSLDKFLDKYPPSKISYRYNSAIVVPAPGATAEPRVEYEAKRKKVAAAWDELPATSRHQDDITRLAINHKLLSGKFIIDNLMWREARTNSSHSSSNVLARPSCPALLVAKDERTSCFSLLCTNSTGLKSLPSGGRKTTRRREFISIMVGIPETGLPGSNHNLKPLEVDSTWKRIAQATQEGTLGTFAVATIPTPKMKRNLIFVKTNDFRNKDDVTRVRDKLRQLGISHCTYKSDAASACNRNRKTKKEGIKHVMHRDLHK